MTPAIPTRAALHRLTLGLLLIGIALVLMIDPAFAQATSSGSFSCSAGKAVGTLSDYSSSCRTVLTADHIFSFAVCNMEQLANNLMGNVYCSVVQAMLPGVLGMLTLAVLFFGMGFTIGVIPATARDFQLFLLKMMLVFLFATRADFLIGVGYNILVDGLRQGTALGLSAMYKTAAATSGSTITMTTTDPFTVYDQMDKFLGKTMQFATDYIGGTWDGSAITATNNPCKNAIFAVLAIMAIAFPPVFYIGVMIIFRVGLTFLRAVFGYLYSIIGIVFLLSMAPIFLTFALFKATTQFFQKWVGYLVSFSLQMVVLFSFLGFVMSINVQNISGSLVDIVMPLKQTFESTTMRWPMHYCTVCDFEVVDKSGQPFTGNEINLNDTIGGGKLQCKTPVTPIDITTASAPGQKDVANNLLKFAMTGLLSLLVLAYIIEYILNYVPALASLLAGGLGGSYAPQLGGADPMGQKIAVQMPGDKLINSFEEGFTEGFSQNMNKTTLIAAPAGTAQGLKYMILGGPRDPKTGMTNDPGLVDSMTTFLFNPQDNDYDR